MNLYQKLFTVSALIAFSLKAFAVPYYGPSTLESLNLTQADVYGSAKAYDSTFGNLNVNGALEFGDIDVKGTLNVFGSLEGESLKATNLTINGAVTGKDMEVINLVAHGVFNGEDIVIGKSITVNGALKGNNMRVKGLAKVYGNLEASDSNFQKLVLSTEATLENSTAKSVTFEAQIGNEPQKLYLENSTILSDVEFKSGNGEVFMDSNSVIHGKVKGGIITNN